MQVPKDAVLLRIFFGESDRFGRQWRCSAIRWRKRLLQCRRDGLDAALFATDHALSIPPRSLSDTVTSVEGFDGSKWSRSSRFWTSVRATTKARFLSVLEIARLAAYRRSTGATVWLPLWLCHLARAYAELGQFDNAWRFIGEAMTAVERAKERWYEAEVNRVAGQIALKSPEPDPAKAEAYFERARAVARQQQAKSWELRASMSLARLWRDQGKVPEARELLAPVYGWFTEGFDTRDLKEAKALLEELAA